MHLRKIAFSLTLLWGVMGYAQEEKKVIFTYGQDTVYADEFMRVFKKNNKPEEFTDSAIQDYLELYINFKLKVKEAHMEGMHNSAAFQSELAGYREQLAKSYMTDTSLTSQLIDEAYERMKQEVHASHILILCKPNALPKDTLAAYRKINQLRNKALKGADFDTLAYYNSEDPSAKNNLGDLGYFTAFDMIYPFETQAYQTEVGGISPVFRTEFGYHILHVEDKRPSRGDVRVAHIMLKLNQGASEAEIIDKKRKIDSIYAQLQSGANWKDLVATYSEDAGSSQSGGELSWIGSLSKNAIPFRDAAFDIEEIGGYSKPVKTQFGWHIIKLLERRGLADKEELAGSLRSQVSREPARVRMSKAALVEKLEKENELVVNDAAKSAVINAIDSSVIKGTFKASDWKGKKEVLFTIGSTPYTREDFGAYLQEYQVKQEDAALRATAENHFQSYLEKSMLDYEEAHLDEKYPAFRYLMQEYHDGILLFNLTEEKVWNKAIKDTTGLKEFYEAHKSDYMWPDRLHAVIYECADKSSYRMVKKLLRKDTKDVEISQQVNAENPLSLVIKRSKFERGENAYVDDVKWKEGVRKLGKVGDSYIIVRVIEFMPAGPKELKEIRGVMTGKYQDHLEDEWVKELRDKYKVVVNKEVLDSLLK